MKYLLVLINNFILLHCINLIKNTLIRKQAVT